MLVAAALLSIPARRIRALARGDQHALRDWLANESANRLAEARRDARETMRTVASSGARVVTISDDDYPIGLLDLPDPPPFLVVRGHVPAGSSGGAGTAIVGTRDPSEDGARFAFELARFAPPPIVSGLALGIDAAAHRGALSAGAPTIAYVGHGLGATYPAEHGDLEDEIVRAGGAVASERLPGERVSRWSLIRRDRLQAAHARAVVLVESEPGGGEMHAMRFARALGRARFATPGNREALTDGASEIEAAAPAAAIRLQWRSRTPPSSP